MVAKVLMITVASAAVAAATYFALDAKFPQTQAESASANTGDVDAIFAGTLDPDAAGTAQIAAADVDTGTVAETDAPIEHAEVAAADDVSTAPDRAAAESEAAPEATAEPTMESAPAPTAEPTPAPTAAPTPEPTAEATAKPSAAPTAATEPVEAPEPSPAARATATAKPSSKPAAPKPALTQWWGTPSDQRLSITYAGSAAYTRAIVLMFNGAFDDASKAAANLSVADASGKPVAGTWQVGSANKRMLLFPVSKNGRYFVSVGGALADRNGRSLGAPLQGPVHVR